MSNLTINAQQTEILRRIEEIAAIPATFYRLSDEGLTQERDSLTLDYHALDCMDKNWFGSQCENAKKAMQSTIDAIEAELKLRVEAQRQQAINCENAEKESKKRAELLADIEERQAIEADAMQDNVITCQFTRDELKYLLLKLRDGVALKDKIQECLK